MHGMYFGIAVILFIIELQAKSIRGSMESVLNHAMKAPHEPLSLFTCVDYSRNQKASAHAVLGPANQASNCSPYTEANVIVQMCSNSIIMAQCNANQD